MIFDHIAIACEDLETGAAQIGAALGVEVPAAIGRHALMGTWNRLLSLGGTEYLELIAVDPGAPPPGRPRWFGLDGFSGPPRIMGWVCSVADLETGALPGAGRILEFERGPYRWQMALPEDARMPFGGLQPEQIRWDSAHPALALPESPCRLERLVLSSPEAPALAGRLAGMADPRLVIEQGPAPRIRAEIRTPAGICVL